MKTLDVRRYSMLVRVREFGAAHADLFPADTLGAHTLAELGALVDRLDGHVASESFGRSAARLGALSKAAARDALRGALDAITRTAQGLALDTPDAPDTFQPPVRASDHELATAARRFAAGAAPLAPAFVAHGLPATFVADLGARITDFERVTNEQAAAKETHVGARAAIGAALDAAFATLRRLDVIVDNRVGGDPNLLAAWRCARHVERTPVRTGPPVTPSASPTPPAPPSVPAAAASATQGHASGQP
jgi:hypothetical protein